MKSFLSYVGGKSLLAGRIIPLIPKHVCYCEVFAGAAWLLFKKDESEVEVINDINADLVTLYHVIKHHLDEFVRYFRWALVARDEFARLRAENPETLTDIQRAARFYYLLKNGFSSRLYRPTFGTSTQRGPRLNLLRIEEELSEAHLRLARVYVENLPFQEILARYDRETTFFYLDPPYYGCEDYYGKGVFERADFERLRDILRGLKGRFIMSINDAGEIRSLFREFTVRKVETSYSIGGADRKKRVVELLIKNF